ncbi:MAG: hypothetical protein LBG17_04615 [Bacteroidales bacterium]|jgi:hypothetical protein|nr:hypothetical protein [Bacteroidales bacterium]
MKIKTLLLQEITENPDNPRTISDSDFRSLISSVLGFPRMLKLRPIVVDKQNHILGGNMRYRALRAIAEMNITEIEQRLSGSNAYLRLSSRDKQLLITDWAAWVDNPTINAIFANELTPEQIKEFVIRDNVQHGKWDWGMLANEWDESLLKEWNVNSWEWDSKDDDLELRDRSDLNIKDVNLFSITFTFPKEYEDDIKAYDKKELTEKIINICQSAEAR